MLSRMSHGQNCSFLCYIQLEQIHQWARHGQVANNPGPISCTATIMLNPCS
jgi:hypothetical protein